MLKREDWFNADPFANGPPTVGATTWTRLDALLRTELDLITARVTWLVISQSFLFSAFAIAAGNKETAFLQYVLLLLTPILGILISYLADAAVCAAHQVATDLNEFRLRLSGFEVDERGIPREADEERRPDADAHLNYYLRNHRVNQTDGKGALPSKMIPRIFIGTWIILFCVVVGRILWSM
jgi:hypothetical protein